MSRALAIVCVLAGAASASPWKATRGTLEAGVRANSFILSSDAAPGRYSEAAMVTAEPVAVPYTIGASWRRLGPEAGRSMHVLVSGGVVLIKSGAVAFYAYDDAAFAQGDWQPIAGHLAQMEHTIAVSQNKHRVTVMVDGAEVAHYDLETTRDRATIGFGMKSSPGFRSSIYVRDIFVMTQSQ